jgi:hypothetical protein
MKKCYIICGMLPVLATLATQAEDLRRIGNEPGYYSLAHPELPPLPSCPPGVTAVNVPDTKNGTNRWLYDDRAVNYQALQVKAAPAASTKPIKTPRKTFSFDVEHVKAHPELIPLLRAFYHRNYPEGSPSRAETDAVFDLLQDPTTRDSVKAADYAEQPN